MQANTKTVRGQGGNMAMLDGFRLAKILGTATGRPIEDSLKEYEGEMNQRCRKAVLVSRAAVPTGDASWSAVKSGQIKEKQEGMPG